MKKHALLLALPLLLWGCRKDVALTTTPTEPEAALTVRVEPTWNGVPFDKSITYLNALDQRVKVSQLKFYLSGLQLIGDTSALLFDADLFDLTDGPLTRSYSVPVSSFDSIAVGLGLPYELNHAEPVLYPVTHPLGAGSGMLWNWIDSFHRFAIFEGRYDTDPNATGLPPFQFSIHTGRDACYRTKRVAHALVTTKDATAELVLEVDVAEFFENEAGTQQFNLTLGSQSHGSIEELPQAEVLSDMMINAVHAH